jgi:hypothetical protein
LSLASKDFENAFAYQSNFTGNPSQRKSKVHDLYYYRADVAISIANLENDEDRQLKLYQKSILRMEEYLDKFKGYDSDKTRKIESTYKRFLKKTKPVSF